MKNIIKLTILLALFVSKSYAQVTTTIDQVFVNNQTTVTSCNTINFGTTQNNSLIFYYTLTKSGAIGDGTITIYLKYSSSSNPTLKTQLNIPSSFWSPTQYQSTIPCNIGENEVQVSGSSIYLEFSSGGSNYKTICEYPIIKTPTPTFTLSPTSINVGCGSTSPVTFSVTNVYSSPGTLTYNWSVGSGWSGSYNSSMSSITLTPTSYPPGSISVTPVLNSISQPTKTCNVSLSLFTQTAAIISGANSICTPATSGVYSISNQGTNTVTWSSSNTAIATVSATTGTSITVNKVTNGTFNLIARITNACNQYLDVIKSIRIGSGPSFNVTKVANTGGYDLAIVNVPSTENQGITSATWVKTSGNGTITGYGLTGEAHGSPTSAWTVTANITATNDCGSTTISKTYSSAGDGTHKMSIVPTKYNIYILDDVTDSETKSSTNDIQIKTAALFDLNGLKIQEFKSNYFDVSTIKKGVYILKVETNDELITSKIVVK
ncbi:T9SS type A sorting domain-containing protein [Flavobacterium paronense]|uniref:T9SS type A sorting domain-containing protein n=1 Tax=Flavobacterium paronense TaxID=1392775 RepID=A0ABV5GF18_9FLAO|nr:T9SS type A sorting domain-containing protein [Flavobacterium paronense]MDN3678476.1 T9SS type A sorting domain-containing protein [Flavobacterium paronense]